MSATNDDNPTTQGLTSNPETFLNIPQDFKNLKQDKSVQIENETTSISIPDKTSDSQEQSQSDKKSKQPQDNLIKQSNQEEEPAYFKNIITTREQRIQRIRARIVKDPQGYGPHDIDAMYKIVLIGDSGVGKTSLLLRFSDDIFNNNPYSTIGVDFKIKTLKVDNKIIKMQIWDTAGQERFRSISQTYFRNANGCIAVYDITKKESFESLKQQIIQFIQYQGGPLGNIGNTHTNHENIKKKTADAASSKKNGKGENPSAQYLHTEYLPEKSQKKKRANKDDNDVVIENDKGGSQKMNEYSYNLPMLRNIVLVGTKQDLCDDSKKEKKPNREVQFSEAIELCRQYGLSACIEVSSRFDLQYAGQVARSKINNQQKKEGMAPYSDLNDCFYISACNSVDYTTRQILAELGDKIGNMPPTALGNKSFFNNSMNESQYPNLNNTSLNVENNASVMVQEGQSMILRQQKKNDHHIINNTVIMQGNNVQLRQWQAYSEDGTVNRAKLAANNDSFYSFKLTPVHYVNNQNKGIQKNNEKYKKKEVSEYDGMIHRKNWPTKYNNNDTESSSSSMRNGGCC